MNRISKHTQLDEHILHQIWTRGPMTFRALRKSCQDDGRTMGDKRSRVLDQRLIILKKRDHITYLTEHMGGPGWVSCEKLEQEKRQAWDRASAELRVAVGYA